jgi:hypothetical protein
MRNFIGARRVPDFSAANVAGIWSLDDISFFRTYGYITEGQLFKTSHHHQHGVVLMV